jgi:Spy/CpxP family protein refolding chaperone
MTGLSARKAKENTMSDTSTSHPASTRRRGSLAALALAGAVGALVATFAVPATVDALPGRAPGLESVLGGDLGSEGRLLARIVARLDLREEQREAIRDILRQQAPSLGGALHDVKNTRLALFAAIHAHPSSEADVRAASITAGQAMTELAVQRAVVVDAIYAELDPSQQAELRTMEGELVDKVEAWSVVLGDVVRSRLGLRGAQTANRKQRPAKAWVRGAFLEATDP